MQKIIMLYFIPFLLLGCDVVDSYTFRSYVNTYYHYSDLSISITNSGNIVIKGADFIKQYTWKSEGRDKVVYDSLCVLHGDMSYNKRRDYLIVPDWGHCSMNDIESINVVSNSNYDNQHLSGTSLNDMIRFISVSPQKFIDSNYSTTYNWDLDFPESFKKESNMTNFKNSKESVCFFPINKKLSEVDMSDLKLLMPEIIGYLIFEFSPSLDKTHLLSVTFKLSNGTIINKTIEKSFN